MGLGAVGQDYVQFFDVIKGLAIDDRVRAAGVVAYAAAHAGTAGCSGVWRVHQAVGNQLAVQVIQDDAGLDSGPLFLFIYFYYLVQVLAEIGDDGMVHRLSGQAGATGPRQHWHTSLVGHLYHGQNIFHISGNNHAHRLHLVDAGIGAVKHSGERVKLDLAGDPAL